MRCRPLVALVAIASLAGCTRSPGQPASTARGSRTQGTGTVAAIEPTMTRTPANAPHRRVQNGGVEEQKEEEEDENGSREVLERIEDLSPYSSDEAGLTQLWRDVVAAAARSDRPAVEAVLLPTAAIPDNVSLALTFEGGRVLVPFISGPAGTAIPELVTQALRYGALTQITVTSATGAQISATGTPLTTLNPEMRAIGSLLRPLARWYRVTLAEPGGAHPTVLESFVYAGGRWMYVAEPWRFAPGAPARDTTAPVQSWARRIPAVPAR